jgi:hypothetical protein
MGVALKYMGLGLALGAAWGGIARSGLAQPTQTDRPSIIRVEADDNDGDEPLVTIGAAPAIVPGVSGDVIGVELTLDSSVARRFGVRCSYELIDGRGITVQRPVTAELASVVSGSAVRSEVALLIIPAGLADGRFEIRIAVAAADGVQGTLQVAERYITISHGRVTPTKREEWLPPASANQGGQ